MFQDQRCNIERSWIMGKAWYNTYQKLTIIAVIVFVSLPVDATLARNDKKKSNKAQQVK